MAILSPNKKKTNKTELGEIWRLVFEKTGGFRQKLGSVSQFGDVSPHPAAQKKDWDSESKVDPKQVCVTSKYLLTKLLK